MPYKQLSCQLPNVIVGQKNSFFKRVIPDTLLAIIEDPCFRTHVHGISVLGGCDAVSHERTESYLAFFDRPIGTAILGHIRDMWRAIRQTEKVADHAEIMCFRDQQQRQIFRRISQNQPPLDFLRETRSIRDDKSWKSGTTPLPSEPHFNVNSFPAHKTRMWRHALQPHIRSLFADFEDAQSNFFPWVLQGLLNAEQAHRGTLQTQTGERMNPDHGDIFVRFRALHQPSSFVVDGDIVPGALVDFVAYATLVQALTREGVLDKEEILAYLPKLQNHHEARLWRDWIATAQAVMGLNTEHLAFKILIETFTSGFEIDEINHELCDFSKGTNDGRYDYIFHFINKTTLPVSEQKQLFDDMMSSPEYQDLDSSYQRLAIRTALQNITQYEVPDLNLMTMDQGFLKAYATLTSQQNNQRVGFVAEGGMMVGIPASESPSLPQEVLQRNRVLNAEKRQKLTHDKRMEALRHKSGAWTGHPFFASDVAVPFQTVWATRRVFKALVDQCPEHRSILERLILTQPHALPRFIQHTLTPECLDQIEKGVSSKEILATFQASLKELHSWRDELPTEESYREALRGLVDYQGPSDAVSARDLSVVPAELRTPERFTEAGLLKDIDVFLTYVTNWIMGEGCIPLNGNFEDKATAEAARSQLRQLLTFGTLFTLDNGDVIEFTPTVFSQMCGARKSHLLSLIKEDSFTNKPLKDPNYDRPLVAPHPAEIVNLSMRLLELMVLSDQPIGFIDDLASRFMYEPVRQDRQLWDDAVKSLEVYDRPLDRSSLPDLVLKERRALQLETLGKEPVKKNPIKTLKSL